VFRFDDVDVPAPMTIQTHVIYYIRSLTEGDNQARGKVTFDLTQVGSAGTNQKYSGLQALVMPRSSFDTWVGRQAQAQCSMPTSQGSTDKQGTPAAGHLVLDNIPGLPPVSYDIKGPKESTSLTVDLPQSKSETYVLVFSNCGSVAHKGIKVQGTVSVKSPHGYLPAHDHPKRVFYAVIVVCYTITSLVWAVAAISRWPTLIGAQKGMIWVSILGVIENASFFISYEVWNRSGIYSNEIFMVAMFCYAWKLGSAFHILFGLARRPADADGKDASAGFGLSLVVALYVIAEFNAKVVQSYRLSRELKLDMILLNSAPAVVMSLVLYVWANVALLDTTTALKEQDENHASAFFHSQVLVMISMMGGIFAVAAEVLDPTSGDPDSWSHHWVCADGVRQIAFLVIFVGASAVWFPSDATSGYNYQPTEGGQAVETIGAVHNDDPEDGTSLMAEPEAKAVE